MQSIVRIGNAQAFWGDCGDAAAELLAQEPELDYLTLDYLAEVSMSILAAQRERDPEAGYARDFIEVVRSLVPYWSAGGRCRLIVNAGGLNPRGCAQACSAAMQEAGCRSLRIGIVSGDDVLSLLQTASANASQEEFANLDTQASLAEVAQRLLTANAYLGAAPIVEALAAGAEIVITGRVADPALAVAACVHHFGWHADDWNRLAGATVAGHLIECGTQVTGGISTDWLELPDAARLGFPIVEVADDGSCLVTKPPGSGGRVTAMTVKEQLVYEIGDPARYLSPDVTVSFLTLKVEDMGHDRVRVSGASGSPPSDKYKVSATYHDGYRAAGTLTLVGRHAVDKAARCGEFVLQRVRDAGFELRKSVVECLGSGACSRGIVSADEVFETVLRVAVESESREACERFSRELMPLVTAGPQGTTGYAEGRPRVRPVVRYWPCLIDRDAVVPRVEQLVSPEALAAATFGTMHSRAVRSPNLSRPHQTKLESRPVLSGRLYDIACARSGDKGTSANIGVIARRDEDWETLRSWLTVERVTEYFAPYECQSIGRYELPNLCALNFVLHGVLDSMRTDAQGKALGQILLEMPLTDLPDAYNGI